MEQTQNGQILQNMLNKVIAIKQTIFCVAMSYEDPVSDKLTELIRSINTEHSYASALYQLFESEDELVNQVEQMSI